jgi:hypothetical protein
MCLRGVLVEWRWGMSFIPELMACYRSFFEHSICIFHISSSFYPESHFLLRRVVVNIGYNTHCGVAYPGHGVAFALSVTYRTLPSHLSNIKSSSPSFLANSTNTTSIMDSTTIYTHVHSRYSATARTASTTDHAKSVAQAFGYSAVDLASIPNDSNLGLSCGNPLALANLRPGETVIDLGCGAGFDVFLAAKKLGANGRAIGVDMNEVSSPIYIYTCFPIEI